MTAADSWIPRVAAAALASFADTMAFLGLANGKRQGEEFLVLNPRRADNAVGSFSINAMTGAWGDFAIGASGLDMVSLCAYLNDEKQSDAARRLAQHFGIVVPAGKSTAPQDAGEEDTGRPTQTPSRTGNERRPFGRGVRATRARRCAGPTGAPSQARRAVARLGIPR